MTYDNGDEPVHPAFPDSIAPADPSLSSRLT